MSHSSSVNPFAKAVLLSEGKLKASFSEKTGFEDLFGEHFMHELLKQENFDIEKAVELFSGEVNALLGQIEMWMWYLSKYDGTETINQNDQLDLFEKFNSSCENIEFSYEDIKKDYEDEISAKASFDLMVVFGRALRVVKMIDPSIHREFITGFPRYNEIFKIIDRNRLYQNYYIN